jgi:hypothetical protein
MSAIMNNHEHDKSLREGDGAGTGRKYRLSGAIFILVIVTCWQTLEYRLLNVKKLQ